MLVKYKKTLHNGITLHPLIPSRYYTYQKTITTMCCTEMEDAFGEYIVFGEVDSSGMNMDYNINITKCSPYPEGAVFSEMAIRFCPFCGTKIVVEEEK